MARVRSPNSIEAEQLYREGMKLVDIAKKFGVPASTVRRWKSTQKWDDNQEEPQRVIRMLLDMSLPFLNEIRMRRSMEHILQSIGMHWMRKKYHSCRRFHITKRNCYNSRLLCIVYGNVSSCIRLRNLKRNQKRDCMLKE